MSLLHLAQTKGRNDPALCFLSRFVVSPETIVMRNAYWAALKYLRTVETKSLAFAGTGTFPLSNVRKLRLRP